MMKQDIINREQERLKEERNEKWDSITRQVMINAIVCNLLGFLNVYVY